MRYRAIVPETGLEPAHLAIRDPKSRASANFATPANDFIRSRASTQLESFGFTSRSQAPQGATFNANVIIAGRLRP